MGFEVNEFVMISDEESLHHGKTGFVTKPHFGLDIEVVYSIRYSESSNIGMFSESQLMGLVDLHIGLFKTSKESVDQFLSEVIKLAEKQGLDIRSDIIKSRRSLNAQAAFKKTKATPRRIGDPCG